MNMLESFFSPFQLTKDYHQHSKACVHVRGMVQSSAETTHDCNLGWQCPTFC